MSKHRIKNLAEQIADKGHGNAPFHQEKMNDQSSPAVKVERLQANTIEDDNDIKLRAYQIHLEKGGSDIDNWLEAEGSLRNNGRTSPRFKN